MEITLLVHFTSSGSRNHITRTFHIDRQAREITSFVHVYIRQCPVFEYYLVKRVTMCVKHEQTSLVSLLSYQCIGVAFNVSCQIHQIRRRDVNIQLSINHKSIDNLQLTRLLPGTSTTTSKLHMQSRNTNHIPINCHVTS